MSQVSHLSVRQRRRTRVRAKIRGMQKQPRLSVFRSHKHIYAQIIDDEKGKTLVAASDKEVAEKSASTSKIKKKEKSTQKQSAIDQAKLIIARLVGQKLAQKAKKAKINQVVFDRGHYAYHGRVKALAEGARSGGLKF